MLSILLVDIKSNTFDAYEPDIPVLYIWMPHVVVITSTISHLHNYYYIHLYLKDQYGHVHCVLCV